MDADIRGMTRARVLTVTAAAVAVLGLSGCGSAVPAGGQTTSTGDGDVVTFTTPSGLACDVYDTTSGGGVSCDFAAFAPPAQWRPGVVEQTDVADGTLSVVVYADAHYCVTFDGYESGAITCAYPDRDSRERPARNENAGRASSR